MGSEVSERQVIAEIDQIQKHLLKKYGPEGVADETLQEQLRILGRKNWEARKLIEGALVFNRTQGAAAQNQEKNGQNLQVLGEVAKVGPAVAGYGNSVEGRRIAREFLGLEKPQIIETPSRNDEQSQLNSPRNVPKATSKSDVTRAQKTLANPFRIETPNLKLQAELLERSPNHAREMILAAKRNPAHFGL